MVVGGNDGEDTFERVFVGKRQDDENDVTQNELQSMRQSRNYHVVLKVINSLYVAGGYDEKLVYTNNKISMDS